MHIPPASPKHQGIIHLWPSIHCIFVLINLYQFQSRVQGFHDALALLEPLHGHLWEVPPHNYIALTPINACLIICFLAGCHENSKVNSTNDHGCSSLGVVTPKGKS